LVLVVLVNLMEVIQFLGPSLQTVEVMVEMIHIRQILVDLVVVLVEGPLFQHHFNLGRQVIRHQHLHHKEIPDLIWFLALQVLLGEEEDLEVRQIPELMVQMEFKFLLLVRQHLHNQ
jgi:hypothetical protein